MSIWKSLSAPLRRRWDSKDVAIAVLGLLVVVLGVLVVQERLAAGWLQPEREGEAVAVYDVVLDREGRAWIDVVFDRPLGEEWMGEVLGDPPATLTPAVPGVWRWQDASILRFSPTSPFPMATEYTVSLIPSRLLGEEQYLAGEAEFTVRTDQFLVERVEAHEEPTPEGGGRVVFRGNVHFNYDVRPEDLASRIRLVDPLRGEADPVEVSLEIYYPSSVIGFRSGEVVKRAEERELRLVIDSSLTPYQGNVTLGEDVVREIHLGSSEVLDVRGLDVEPGEERSALRLRLTSPVVAGEAADYVSVEPAVDFRAAADRNVLVLSGPFRPGERYRVAVDAGLRAADGALLQEGWSTEVLVPNLEPSVGFRSQGMFLLRSGLHNLALETVNVGRVRLAIDRVYENNLFTLFQYHGHGMDGGNYDWPLNRALGDRLVETEIPVAGRPNRRAITPLDLDDWVDVEEPGFYRVVVARPGHWEASQLWVLLTDVGIVAKRSGDGFLVWVSSFDDLAPISGARVRLISDQNQLLAEGRTDGSGLWRVDELAGRGAGSGPDAAVARARGGGPGEPYLVTVERGGQFSFLWLDRTRIDTAGLEVGGAAAAGPYTAYLYGERDLYRPGETVEGVAVLRDSELRPPPPMPAVLRHRGPDGQVRETFSVRSDGRGLADFALDVPAYAPTGRHSLELLVADERVGQYLFQVEEFVPDRIAVEIDPATDSVAAAQELRWEVASHYLFGPPASELPVESRVRLVASAFAPEGFAQFSFSDPDREFDEREVFAAEERLDPEGRAGFTTEMPAALTPPSGLEAVVTARVSERGGRGVTARRRVRVHPYPYYLGLRRAEEGYVEPGQTAEFDWVAVSPDGDLQSAGALRADLYRDTWNTVLRRTPAGNYRYESSRESELVDSVPLEGGGSRGSFSFEPAVAGAYRAVISDPETSASTSLQFYVSGWGFSPWAVEDPSRIELELEHDEYRPGQTARLQVRAPFSGRLLVTVERDRIHRVESHRLDGNTATIDLPVRGAWRPNVYVTATLVRPVEELEPGTPGRAFGAVPLNVDRGANRLEVGIDAPTEVRSESTLPIRVRTEPGSAVTVAAVDVGILQLIAQQTPDPFDHFYRRRRLQVDTYDIFSLLLPEVAAAAAGGGEAAAGLAQYVRTEGMRRVEPVAYWSGVLEAGSDGVAEVEMAVPEYQGALRVMAVSIDGRRFGSSDLQVRVRDPLVVMPTFPRILSFGDEAEIPVTVRNDTGQAGEFRVELTAEELVASASRGASSGGPGGEVDGLINVQDEPRMVEIDEGAEATVYPGIRVGDLPGEVRLRVTATGNGEEAGSSAVLGIRPHLPRRTVERAGSLAEASTTLAADAVGWARDGTLRRELRVGAVPLVQFSGKLAHLLRYPYGCLEQTVSAAFPLIHLEDLARRLEPELFDDEGPQSTPAAYVQNAIRRAATLQLYNGAFPLWPGSQRPDPWVSLYTTHFLVEADRAGYGVSDTVLRPALDWLAQSTRGGRYGSEELQRATYALWVLARAGRPELGTMDHLRERYRNEMSPETRAMLAAAYVEAGVPGALEELAHLGREIDRVERQTGENLDSALRNRALLLMALLRAEPESGRIPSLVDRLVRDLEEVPRWTTQEEAFALLALGQFYRRQQDRGPFSGTVYVGDAAIGTFDERGAAFPDIRGRQPIRLEMDEPYESGAVFYSLLTRGVPTDGAFRPEEAGLQVERQLLDRDGAPIPGDAVEQGDLVVVRFRVRSVAGPLENVVIEQLLPAGLEVENPRLESREDDSFGGTPMETSHVDLRDDRVLLFLDLPGNEWRVAHATLRAVTPGSFKLPPIHAEAMYDPAIRATGPVGRIEVERRGGEAERAGGGR